MVNFACGYECTENLAARIVKEIVKIDPSAYRGKGDEDIIRTATSEDLAAAISAMNQMPVVRGLGNIVDRELIEKFDEQILRNAHAVPVSIYKNIITIAEVNPMEPLLRNHVAKLYGSSYSIQEVVAVWDEIQGILNKFDHEVRHIGEELLELDDVEDNRVYQVLDLDEEDDDPVRTTLRDIIKEAIIQNASDIHFARERDKFYWEIRVDGDMCTDTLLDPKAFERFDKVLRSLAGGDKPEAAHKPFSGRLLARDTKKGVEFDIRYERTPLHHGSHVTLRLINLHDQMHSLGTGALELHPVTLAYIRKIISASDGLVVISGPTGSGKSTTLRAMVNYINDSRYNILTIENPVEGEIPGVKQVSLDDVKEIPSYIASFNRSDPDIAVIAEMRDLETALGTINLANTGHLVFSTTHCKSASSIPNRINDLGVDMWKCQANLIGLLSQRLVKKLCPECRHRYTITKEDVAFYNLDESFLGKEVWKAATGGCVSCKGKGYRGRQALIEVIPVDEKVRELMGERNSVHLIEQHAFATLGIPSIRSLGLHYVENGITSLEALSDVVTLTIK